MNAALYLRTSPDPMQAVSHSLRQTRDETLTAVTWLRMRVSGSLFCDAIFETICLYILAKFVVPASVLRISLYFYRHVIVDFSPFRSVVQSVQFSC